MRREDAAVRDMLDFARDVLAFTDGFDEAAFCENRVVQAAVLYQLTAIGEAVRRVLRPTRLAHPEVPWIRISNLRNVIVHEYDDVRLPRIWMVVTRDIPALVAVLDPIVLTLDVGRVGDDPE
jgi:uncharacterized protein with HEPN domain